MDGSKPESSVEETEYALSFYHYCFPQEDRRCKIAEEIKNIVPVIMLAIGLFGNSLNVTVLTRRKFRKHPFLLGLILLSVSDTLQLLLNVMSIHVIQRLDNTNMYRYCNFDGLATLSQGTFSCYILAILTLERTIYVRYPHKSKKFLTMRVYMIVFGCVMAFIILFHTFLIFGGSNEVLTISNSTAINATSDPLEEYRVSCIYISLKHDDSYRPYLMILMVFIDNFTPLMIVCVGNILIIKAVKESRARVTSDTSRESRTQETATKIAKTVCIFFFVSTSPLMISKTVQGIVKVPPEVYPTISLIDMILYVFVQCNFAFNFIMYFWTGSVFREECKVFYGEFKGTFDKFRLKNNPSNLAISANELRTRI